MARCLIIGCGCRGRSLAREMLLRGHAVRGTTRRPDNIAAIEACGAEAVLGDPDVIATLAPALDRVTVVCVLLGSAAGTPAQLSALHGTRLGMLLTRVVDTTVRGVVYETAGSVSPALLSQGASLVRARCEDSRIPFALLEADPGDFETWSRAAAEAVDGVLGTTSAPR